MNQLHLTHLQITLKSPTGCPVSLDLRYTEKDVKAYRALVRDTLEGLGFEVDYIALGYDNLPPGVAMVPVEIVKTVKAPPPPPEPEVEVSELEQYKNKPRMMGRREIKHEY